MKGVVKVVVTGAAGALVFYKRHIKYCNAHFHLALNAILEIKLRRECVITDNKTLIFTAEKC